MNGTTMAISWPIVLGLGVAMLAILIFAVKIFDLKRKREDQAAGIQAKLSDALLSDRALSGLAVTPTARFPLWTPWPVTVDVAGQVPTPELRDQAIHLVERQMAASGIDFHVMDRLAVVPSVHRRAA